MPDLKAQLTAMISVWRGTANDCKLTGQSDMLVTAQALENCADEAERLIAPPSTSVKPSPVPGAAR